MKILITNGSTRLSQQIADRLADVGHDVRLTATGDVSVEHDFAPSDLGDDEGTNGLVRGLDAIIHSAAVDTDSSVSDQLDMAMRGTYNLLWAAREEGVNRFVLLSSLSTMGQYDESLAVTERWKPTPTTEPDVLCHHMVEFVCREFAREKKTTVYCLRLGELAWDGQTNSTSALLPEDAFQAVEQALTAETVLDWATIPNTWNVFHIQSSVPNQRFLTANAQDALGFRPASRG